MDTIVINATTVRELLFLIGGLLCGLLMGIGIRSFFAGRRQKKTEAPLPYDMGYNPNNPINQAGQAQRGTANSPYFPRRL